MISDTNLITASPKVGKTTLVVEMLSKWNTGVLGEHLGFEFKGKCPKVILIGTDMPNSRWMPLLAKFGLAKPIGKDGYQFVDPIIAYFSMNRPLHLDDEGLSKIADLCSKNLN